MDKYFIHFDQEGNFLGRYVSAHSEIPSDAVEVSQSLFHQTIDETDGVWKIDPETGEIAKHPFPPAPPYVPQQVTRAQGKAALITAGLWSAMESYVDAIADPTEKALALVALNDTTHWQRTSPFLNSAAAALGLSDEDLDNLFIQASEIEL